MIFISCNRDKPETPVVVHDNTGNTRTTPDDEHPKFTKNGELNFYFANDTVAKKIDIEIADTPAKEQQGLMNRPWMEEDQGMLFIFTKEDQQSFWMKNTIIPLDIIYVNASKKIVSIAKNCTPYSEKPIPSGAPALYVVEVIAGFSDIYNIKPGDRIDWVKM